MHVGDALMSTCKIALIYSYGSHTKCVRTKECERARMRCNDYIVSNAQSARV